jgi:phenylalanyl-tRNA synthetase beta subunit
MRAIEDMCALILEMMPEAKVKGLVDFYPRVRNPYIIGVSAEEVNRKLGLKLKSDEIESILDRFGFEYKKIRPVDFVVENAPSFAGVPYKYGSSISYDTPKCFDCSSFLAYLYSQAGVALPRITVDQFAYGSEISKDELQPGDAIFSKNGDDEEVSEFTVQGEKINKRTVHTFSVEFPGLKIPDGVEHVGIYLGDNKIIHASGGWHKGQVVIEDLDQSPAFKEIRGYRRFSLNEERYAVTVPSERLDLMSKRAFLVSGNKEDLIEEIGRVYGYENIESIPLPNTEFEPVVNKELFYSTELRSSMKSKGFSEVITYAFKDKGEVEIENPLASDKKFLRSSLLPSLEDAVSKNKRNKDLLGLRDIKIFEIGRVFKEGREILSFASLPMVEEILGQKIDSPEVDLGEIIEGLPMAEEYLWGSESGEALTFKPYSEYPFIVRDLALFVPEGTKPEDVEDIFEPLLGELCVRKGLFDSFLKAMPDGSKRQSYAWRFVFQANDRTLLDEDANSIMGKISERLSEENNFEVR